MDINQGYSILKAVMLENGRGFALGENPKAPQPFVTWACYDDEHGIRQYEWGHYGTDRTALEQDLANRVREYRDFYKVSIHHTEAPGLYKYYSTQRPVDIGTFPKLPGSEPDEIVNYEGRIWVEHDTRLAWGHITYTKPLTEQQIADYELRPSRDNPDLKKRMAEQAQTVGAWEDARHVPDSNRLTWFYPDFGVYVPKEHISPEVLAEAVQGVELYRIAQRQQKRPVSIADQLKAAQRETERQPPANPKKEAPDRGDR